MTYMSVAVPGGTPSTTAPDQWLRCRLSFNRKPNGLRVFGAVLSVCPAQDVAQRSETTDSHADGVAVKRLAIPRAQVNSLLY